MSRKQKHNNTSEFLAVLDRDDRSAVAELLHYPAVVTVSEGRFRVSSPEEFLPYYDEIFTDGLRDDIQESRNTKESASLFTNNGMIGAAGSTIWFAALEGGLAVLTVQNDEGCSLQPEGPSGITVG